MKLRSHFRSFFLTPWVMSLILFLALLLVNGYTLGWDDQHLEIPLLKHLIDSDLYAGDYYVESLKENFSSFFYPILAKFITVEQIPAAYFILYLVSRYFLIFFIYKIWLYLTESPFKAAASVLTFILVIRVDEFLYRTFSHQEFALAVIFGGIYAFFIGRFYLAALVLGLATNIHALYSIFPMFYISIYLLWRIREHGFKKLIHSVSIYLFFSLPFIIWSINNRLAVYMSGKTPTYPNWLALYHQACPQNFFFPNYPGIPFDRLTENPKVFFYFSQMYLFILALFLVNFCFNKMFRQNKKALSVCLGAFTLLAVCFIGTYISPSRLILDLNLCRNTQFLLFFLTGFTVIHLINTAEKRGALIALVCGIILTLLKYDYLTKISALGIWFFLNIFSGGRRAEGSKRNILIVLGAAGLAVSTYGVWASFQRVLFAYYVHVAFSVICLALILHYILDRRVKNAKPRLIYLRLFILIPLILFGVQYSYYHYKKVRSEQSDEGFWRLQRNWMDIQRYVRENTPVDAVILVPYNMEMGGFRIFSERKIVASYRDCGIIGFDYGAARQWRRRIEDIRPFKFNISEPLNSAIIHGVQKYDADYIVFMRYAAPKENVDFLSRLYTNNDFVLYRVMR